MRQSTDQTVLRTIQLVRQCAVRTATDLGGYAWYDITDCGLSAEVTLLRQSGVIAHHPTIRTLIRFDDERR